MPAASASYWADFPGLGFNSQAVFVSANMFNANTFAESSVVEGNKAQMEAGGSAFSFYGFHDLSVSGIPAFSVQPVEALDSSSGSTEYLVSSFVSGDPHGSDCFHSSCHGVALWNFANPIAHDTGGSVPTLSVGVVPSGPYIIPNYAPQPGTSKRLDTDDLRISGTPVFRAGVISAALCTGVGAHYAPGIYWFQISVSSSTITSHGIYWLGKTAAAFYPDMTTDSAGNLVMVFTLSGAKMYPGIAFAVKKPSASDFPLYYHLLERGANWARTFGNGAGAQRWGDYSATTWNGAGSGGVWVSSMYGRRNHDWGTALAGL